ncbi:MAG TPA: TetR/AcrR family transcriptional regulator [Flavobacterium sp.]|nr:TetR/AcrR family transcriptional regulator [Flavobacterium sp.]
MKEKIISKSCEMFLKLGFKSITMDDIANEMSISKKTIYKFFANKEVLIAEATKTVHDTVHQTLNEVRRMGLNAIEENFEVRKVIKGIFQSADNSPLFQLKKHYPEIYSEVVKREQDECHYFLRENILNGIADGYYRKEIDIDTVIRFYYTLVFNINESVALEKEAQALELEALVYHTRAISTLKGIAELEKQLSINSNL